MIRTALLIPTYNEVGNIEKLLKSISLVAKENIDVHLSVFVVDDNSPDGTQEVVKKISPVLVSNNLNINLLPRLKKEGLGKAYIYAISKVLMYKTFDYVIQMDADLSHNPIYLNDFFEAARKSADVVIGSRYIKGGAIPDWAFHRKILSVFGNSYARMLLGGKISDYTGGFNMFSTAILKNIKLDEMDGSGYGFLIALKYNAVKQAKKILQIPIVFVDRNNGESKMPLNTLIKNFILVLRLRNHK